MKMWDNFEIPLAIRHKVLEWLNDSIEGIAIPSNTDRWP